MDYIDKIKALREDNDLSQKQMVKIINKSQQGYSHLENRKAKFTVEDIIDICKFFKIDSNELLGISPKK